VGVVHVPEKKGEWIRWGVILLVAGGAFWFVSHQFESIDLEKLLADISDFFGAWTYLLAGLLAFLETGAFVGLVVPGETFVILAGAVAGQGATDIYVTIAVVWFSAWAGDTTSFFIGRRLGRGFVLRHGSKLRITEERFAQVESYFEKHGGKTILVGRFIGLVRALAPFVAGSSGMEYRAFVPYSVLGTGLWAATFSVLGYFGSRSINEIAESAGTGITLFGLTVAVIVGTVLAVRFFREHENRAKVVAWMDRRAALRPLVGFGRRVKPQAEFLWNRLTPGDLGLELTAMIALLSVAGFVLIGYAGVISSDPGPTPGDELAFDIALDLRADWFTDLNEVVTRLGSATAITIAALAGAAILAVRRRWALLAVLVVSVAALLLSVPALKEGFDRPRPVGGLVEANGDAYPSGHAAYSTIYVWLAVVTALLWRSRIRGTGLIIAGVAVAAAVGLSRIYLHVHYFSDVAGGWALGVCVFTLCSVVALIAVHLRDNPDP
jgi:membrane protein DedA with SNARE-associated domain/membrane-associated phospholipid phosphatase